ncbi:hypothetical protein L5D93_21315 [Paenibacillus thiaminolyticus]|nr:hypothetical protein [Paenibacillus thiaminolyticus]
MAIELTPCVRLAKSPLCCTKNEQSHEKIFQQHASAQKEMGKPFKDKQKLQQLMARQSEINSVLEFKELQAREPL